MERFIYICNNNELIKLIEAFGEGLGVEEVSGQTIFHDEDKTVFAIGKDGEGKIGVWYDDANVKKFTNIIWVETLFNGFKEKIEINNNDKTFISIHPGGTDDIRNQLEKTTDIQENKLPVNVFISYHGSKNERADIILRKEDKINSDELIDLKNAVKEFLVNNKPDNDKEQKKEKFKKIEDEIKKFKNEQEVKCDDFQKKLEDKITKIINGNFQETKKEFLKNIDNEIKRVNENMQKITFPQRIRLLLSKKKYKEEFNNYKEELERFKTKFVTEYLNPK